MRSSSRSRGISEDALEISTALSRQDSMNSWTSSSRAIKESTTPMNAINNTLNNSINGNLGNSWMQSPRAGRNSNATSNSASTAVPPKSGQKKTLKQVSTLPHHKVGRVRVGIRCRPAFQDEIDFANGSFFSIVDCKSANVDQQAPGRVSLTLISGKQRDFMFDYVFDQNATQDYVYDIVARPVVSDVLRGFNGTIFAYGQTGTGKTYTMGILEFVNNEHAGIIPRALFQLFDYVEKYHNVDITITLSFLQLYRETIQDLLAPASGGTVGDENLNIREDPQRGFYVEGLQEFVVRSYGEAEALVNVGLENRAIAPTLMNTTSSRSHTILTLQIEQRGVSEAHGSHGTSYSRTTRSKLLMVDLAGSERVRRTISKGDRLSEAKSINSSLSALGNVIAALAEQNVGHIPYRDSKLTRLLQDSLGGTASTALIATVGPAPVNYGETLSTLLFAARCMAVKTTPIRHEEVDYADLCARLQEKLNTVEGELNAKMLEQQNKYESMIHELNLQLGNSIDDMSLASLTIVDQQQQQQQQRLPGLERLLAYLRGDSTMNEVISSDNWIAMISNNIHQSDTETVTNTMDQVVTLISYCLEVMRNVSVASGEVLHDNAIREEQRKERLSESFNKELENDKIRDMEKSRMESQDPLFAKLNQSNMKIGSHLAPLSRLEAMTRIEGMFRSNNDPTSSRDHRMIKASQHQQLQGSDISLTSFASPRDLANALGAMEMAIQENLASMARLFDRKDKHFNSVKEELSSQLVERRKREEEVVNWSYILKYLLSSSSKLKLQLQQEKSSRLSLDEASSPTGLDRDPMKTAVPLQTGGVAGFKQGQSTAVTRMAGPPAPIEIPTDGPHFPLVSSPLSPLDRVKSRHLTEERFQREELNRSHAKLGARLAGTRQMMSQNRATAEDLNMGLLDGTSATHHGVGDDTLGEDDDSTWDQGGQKTTGTGRPRSVSSATSVSQVSRISRVSRPPSDFARGVVQQLGVQGDSAESAMKIIDRVSQITPQQLDQLDPETKAQIMQIRKDLGLDKGPSGSRPNPNQGNNPRINSTNQAPPQPARSQSTPRMTVPMSESSPAAPLRSQGPQGGHGGSDDMTPSQRARAMSDARRNTWNQNLVTFRQEDTPHANSISNPNSSTNPMRGAGGSTPRGGGGGSWSQGVPTTGPPSRLTPGLSRELMLDSSDQQWDSEDMVPPARRPSGSGSIGSSGMPVSPGGTRRPSVGRSSSSSRRHPNNPNTNPNPNQFNAGRQQPYQQPYYYPSPNPNPNNHRSMIDDDNFSQLDEMDT